MWLHSVPVSFWIQEIQSRTNCRHLWCMPVCNSVNVECQYCALSSEMIGQFVCVLVRFLLLWWDTMSKNNLGGKSLVYLTAPRSQSSTTGSQGRNWSRDCRTLLAPLAGSACFSYMSQVHLGSTTHNGLGPSASVIKKIPHRLVYRTLVNWGFLFLNDCFLSTFRKKKHNVDGFILEYIAFFLQFLKVRLSLIDSLD